MRRQLRAADDALAHAESGNDHLREQMDEQRRRLTESKDRELSHCREHYEDRIATMEKKNQQKTTNQANNIRTLESELDKKSAECSDLRKNCDSFATDCKVQLRDIQMWKSNCEQVEVEMAKSRQAWAEEKMKLEGANDEAKNEISRTRAELDSAHKELADVQSLASLKQIELGDRLKDMESTLKSTQKELTETNTLCTDATHALKKERQVAEENELRLMAVNKQLQRENEMKTRAIEDERKRMEATLEELAQYKTRYMEVNDALERQRQAAERRQMEDNERLQRESEMKGVSLKELSDVLKAACDWLVRQVSNLAGLEGVCEASSSPP